MAQPISSEAIKRATNKTWDEWLKFFASIDAKNLTHKEIAQAAYDKGGAPGWWAQMVTVAYEQHIGRRAPGQDNDGEFSVSASKTIDGTMDDALKQWQAATKGSTEFSGVAITADPDVSKNDKWRYWRVGLADGSKVNINIYNKAPGKASLGLAHEKLESSEAADHWRTYWKQFLTQL
jgi:hypothetical protein